MGEPVYLLGSGAEIGATQGRWQREFLGERIARTFAHAQQQNLEATLHERAARFAQLLSAAAPHWLEEAESLAAAAEIESRQLLALNCLPSDFWGRDYRPAPISETVARREVVDAYDAQGYEPLLGGDCTTFFALGDATVSGETMLHKNRDERDEVQNIYIKHCDGFQRFIGAGDIGNLGAAHLHSEEYWVGANNTGSPIAAEEFQDCALNDCHVLRWLGENCATLDEIVPCLQQLLAKNWIGGGGTNRGSIWLFADATRGLIVEATSHRLAHQWFEESGQVAVRANHFLLPEMQNFCLGAQPNSVRRFQRAVELLEEQEGFVSMSTCGEIGRDRAGAPDAICRNPSDKLGSVTVSTSTSTLSVHDDRRCQTHFRNCHPSYTHAVIVTPLDRVSDSDLLGGAHNQYWRRYRGFP